MPRAGIVTVVGKPNAGKSTLLNRMVGEKLSIVSSKPQSTRDRVVGIRTEGDVQMVILDTPGLLNPRYALQRSMRSAAIEALRDADVVLYLSDVKGDAPVPLMEAAQLDRPPAAHVIEVLNKADVLSIHERSEIMTRMPGALLVSAVTGEGIDDLERRIADLLPESEFLYPADEISTQTVRYFAAEMVRETALDQLEEEIPYSIACEIEEFREDRSPAYIRAVVYVERESQKRILIGAGGSRIKAIGGGARAKIEAFLGFPIYLDLWVKVLPNWRKNPRSLARFGYRPVEDPS